MTGIREIGGYFPLEVARSGAFHPRAKAFLTARGALKQLLLSLFETGRGPKRLWLPTFLCPDIETAISEIAPSLQIIRYAVNDVLQPVGCDPKSTDLAYYYNVFGLTGALARLLPPKSVWDNAHGFFSPPAPGCTTLYSARKFFGVPDGAYLYSTEPVVVPPPLSDVRRSLHLLKRHDQGAQAAFSDFRAAETELAGAPPAGMSLLTRRILEGIDYSAVSVLRLTNLVTLHEVLGRQNELGTLIDAALSDPHFVPFSYPLLIADGAALRERLISKKVFIPLLWSGVVSRPEITGFERHLALDTVHLPIDQRYGEFEMIEVLTRAGF